MQRAEDFDNLHVRAGTLADAKALYDHPEEDGWTPSNLWATKVAGPAPLVEALLNDTELEVLRLPGPTDPDRPTWERPGVTRSDRAQCRRPARARRPALPRRWRRRSGRAVRTF